MALLGRKVKQSIKNQRKRTDLFADVVIMPISMKPNIIIENYEIFGQKEEQTKSRRAQRTNTKVPHAPDHPYVINVLAPNTKSRTTKILKTVNFKEN